METETFRLHVDTLKDGTKVVLYGEVYGNPNGVPAVYLHGGPGNGDTVASAHSTDARDVFDARRYRIILFDQRGCGHSTPRNHLEKNTTEHLLRDVETIRQIVNGGQRWVVAGGSWGSALALLYAQRFPAVPLGLILRGVYDLSVGHPELDAHPEVEQEQEELVGVSPKKFSFVAKSLKIIQGKRTKTRRRLIESLVDDRLMYASPQKNLAHDTPFKDQETIALLSQHYEANHFFMPKNYIYKHLSRIQHIPVIMVQGLYDIICPIHIARKIKAQLPLCKLLVVKAGHTMHEPLIKAGLKRAAKDMLNRIIINSNTPGAGPSHPASYSHFP